jgi:hypothetical protein
MPACPGIRNPKRSICAFRATGESRITPFTLSGCCTATATDGMLPNDMPMSVMRSRPVWVRAHATAAVRLLMSVSREAVPPLSPNPS